jgi:HlyD family secretion protein
MGTAAGAVLLAVGMHSGLIDTTAAIRLPRSHVSLATVTSGPFHDFVPLHGTVVALSAVYVDAIEGGRVQKVLVQAGDAVTAGQSLVELSNRELELDVLDREGRLIESITQVQAYQTQLEQNRVANRKALAQIDSDLVTDRRALDRRKLLLEQHSIAVETVDQLQDQVNHNSKLRPMQEESNNAQERLRVQQLPQIRRQLEALQQDVRITHGTLDDLIVRAPISGRLTTLDPKVGQSLARSARVAIITTGDGYKLAAQVDQFYLARVRAGQQADVLIGETVWPLSVTRVYPQVTAGTFTIDLEFVRGQPPGVLPGQGLQGKLLLGADRAATILPAGAFLDRTGGTWIFVLAPDGRSARRRSIRLGRRNAEQVEVLAGLSPGEHAIVSDYVGLERFERVDLQ